MPNYSNRWKLRTLEACGLPHGVTRSIFQTLIMVSDWKGRSHRPYRELSKLAGVSKISCVRALKFLVEKGFIDEISKGRSHTPTWFQVVPCESKPEVASVSPEDTEEYVCFGIIKEDAPSVNVADLLYNGDYDQAPRTPSGSRLPSHPANWSTGAGL